MLLNVLRKILFPFVPIYYIVTWFRNKLYDWEMKKSLSYDFPMIAVGNLSTGGTGKSPMTEYLITLLQETYALATLSRGYKRESTGFQLVETTDLVTRVGDEPLQFKIKFPTILVGVDSDRRNGIKELRSLPSPPELILLDDAFQHRKVKAGLYILLTAYKGLYCDDIMLPTGDLREPKSGAKRADIVIVTKCPENLTHEEQGRIAKKLRIKPFQKLFFTTIQYDSHLKNGTTQRPISFYKELSFVLVTGIANPAPLIEYYRTLNLKFEHKKYPDHHTFSEEELNELNEYPHVITTEKDYMRLKTHMAKDQLWFQPIQVKFLKEAAAFTNLILDYAKNKTQ